MAKKASYQKLYSGVWGIRVRGKVKVGDEIEVKNRRGQVSVKLVTAIEWTDGDESVCAIALDDDDDGENEPAEKPAKRAEKRVEKRAGKGKKPKAKAAYLVRRGKVTYIRLED